MCYDRFVMVTNLPIKIYLPYHTVIKEWEISPEPFSITLSVEFHRNWEIKTLINVDHEFTNTHKCK